MTEVPPHERRTALLVQVPVERGGRRLSPPPPRGLGRTRIPAHVTVLFPFAAARVRRRAPRPVASTSVVDAVFRGAPRVGRFDEHVWLAPSPRAFRRASQRDTYAGFPGFPPYGDAFAEPVPHLTVAERAGREWIEQHRGAGRAASSRQVSPSHFESTAWLLRGGADGMWRESEASSSDDAAVRPRVRAGPPRPGGGGACRGDRARARGFEESEAGGEIVLGLYVDES